MSSMAKKCKVNPRRHPMTEADTRRLMEQSANTAVGLSLAIFITVLVDKYGWTAEEVTDIWKHLNKLSEEVKEGRVSAWDLKNVLQTEYNILLQ